MNFFPRSHAAEPRFSEPDDDRAPTTASDEAVQDTLDSCERVLRRMLRMVDTMQASTERDEAFDAANATRFLEALDDADVVCVRLRDRH